MNKTQEALKLALKALKQIDEAMPFPVAKLAQQAIREALAEQPAQQQEPVGEVLSKTSSGAAFVRWFAKLQPGDKLYTSPPASKPWVGLTQEDWMEFKCKTHDEVCVGLDVAAKLREKNA